MKFMIVNADDFGASSGINRGIVDGHLRGIITSTSLMVNMPKAEEAVAMSRECPNLSVGLHVAFTSEDCAPLFDFQNADRCRDELERQFYKFRELTGTVPTHLDSHHNTHFRSEVLPAFRDMASKYDLPLRGFSPARYFSKFYGQWGDGLTHLEWISSENLVQLLANELLDGFTELSCHAGYHDPQFHSAYSTEREVELQALCDPMIRRCLDEWNVKLIGFRDVGELWKVTTA